MCLIPIFGSMDEATTRLWAEITSKPKWYAGILNTSGTFYTAQAAAGLKKRFEVGALSLDIIETVFEAHGYVLVKQWRKKPPVWG